MSSRHLLAGPAVVALAIAGCGGSSGPSLSSYKSGFQVQKTSFRQLGSDLGQAISTAPQRSNSQLATEFATLTQRATAQAAGLRKLNPPSKYKPQNDTLAADFDTVAADLKAIATAASTNNGTAARTDSTKLVRDAAQLKSVDVGLTGALGLPQ